MDTVPETLTKATRGLISIGALAERIGIPADRLRLLVEHNYLRVVMPCEQFEQAVVACPGQRAMEWLKNMFQPLKMRPLIPIKEVGELWGITERKVLELCWSYKIPVQSDPVFGKLTSFKALKSFARTRRKRHYPRFDRSALLRYYLSEIERIPWKRPPNYSTRFEIEVARVARLKEPIRTIRSVALIEAFSDARTATERPRARSHRHRTSPQIL